MASPFGEVDVIDVYQRRWLARCIWPGTSPPDVPHETVSGMTKRSEAGQNGTRSETSRDGAATKSDGGASLLPDATTDERELVQHREDDWYQQERPPHHG